MKNYSTFLLLAVLSLTLSCRQNEIIKGSNASLVPKEIIAKLQAAGFVTSKGLSKHENGYLVEYDIFMTEEEINALDKEISTKNNSQGREEHYRTPNIVTHPGLYYVSIDPSFDDGIHAAIQEALNRFNALPLSIQFTTQPGQQTIKQINVIQSAGGTSDEGVFGYSDFPLNGYPSTIVKLNPDVMKTDWFATRGRNDQASIIAHEFGHAIGFRHTDMYNRAYSCLSGGPEPTANAVWISGTPQGTQASPNSWMLACANGVDRPFTADDITALTNLYGAQSSRTLVVKVLSQVDADAWTASPQYSMDGGATWNLLTGNLNTIYINQLDETVPLIFRMSIGNNCSNNAVGSFGYSLDYQTGSVTTNSSYLVGSDGLTITSETINRTANYTITFFGHAEVSNFKTTIVNNLNHSKWSLNAVYYSVDNGATWCLIPGSVKTFSVAGNMLYKAVIQNISNYDLDPALAIQPPHQSPYIPYPDGYPVPAGGYFTIITPNCTLTGTLTVYEALIAP